MFFEEIVKKANSQEGDYSEQDVVNFFKTHNTGHWASKTGEIAFNTDSGKDIILTIGRRAVGANADLTTNAKMWLLQEFFNTHKSQALRDFESLDDYAKDNEKMTFDAFHSQVVRRMSGYSKFIKSGRTRLAFMERQRVNSDESIIYSYDITNLDKDKRTKFAVMVPGVRPLVKVFEEYKGKICSSMLEVDGRIFENMEPWERAEYIASEEPDIFTVSQASKKQVEAAMMLTEVAGETDEDTFTKYLSNLLNHN